MPDSRPDARGGLGTVRNAVTLLELLAEGPGFRALTDLAESSGLSLPTTHRLLRSLALADVVSQDPRTSRYGLGPQLTVLSHRYLSRLPIVTALGPFLVDLRDTLHTTVEVQRLVGDVVVVVDQVDGSEMGAYRRTHTVLQALGGAGGRLLAARCEDEQWARMLDAAPAADRETAEAARQQWAQEPWLSVPADGTLPGEVAVPLLTAGGTAEGALVALLPQPRDDLAGIAGHLGRAAQAAMRSVNHG